LAEEYEHLSLPFVPEEYLHKKRGGSFGYKKEDRDEAEILNKGLQEIQNIKEKHEIIKHKYKQYIDPNLIIKIKVNQSVPEETFRKELERMDIEVISAAPDKKGFWIVFSEDYELKAFQKKFQEHFESEKYDFFYAIDSISAIPSEEKLGESLCKEPFRSSEYSYLDVEIWRMDNPRLIKFITDFRNLISKFQGEIISDFTTNSFCLIRVRTNQELYEAMLELPEIAYIDRPPKIDIETNLNIDLRELKVEGQPEESSTGILVVDSGILSNHPLLKHSVGDEISVSNNSNPSDDVGHGTQVAGIALYGEIDKCIKERSFHPELWIFSAKIMFRDEDGYAKYYEKDLLEKQLDEAVRKITNAYPNCRVVNLSLGNSKKRMYKERRQYILASLIDELYKDLNVIFVVSAGNLIDNIDNPENYPNYLLDDDSDKVKIIDSASSALALTVGALFELKRPSSDDYVLYPSLITRVGPGYKGMIKPEFVENGGGGFAKESEIITINPNWISEGRLFTLNSGTSFSAPKVAHYIAKLINKYPNFSRNLVKSLLIYSAIIPRDRPIPLSEIDMADSDKKITNLFNVYGYGKPNIDKALRSDDNRVVLIKENTIKLNHFHLYPIYLPEEFIEEPGDKSLSITLVYDPPTNRNRSDYLGSAFEFHLFKNASIQEVIDEYRVLKTESASKKINNDDEKVPKKLKGKEIFLHPGVLLRKKSPHQKGLKLYKGKPNIDPANPLILVVYCLDRWIRDENYIQDYAVIAAIEHSGNIELYNKLRLRNREKIEIRQRT
jgi:hypothetical protein